MRPTWRWPSGPRPATRRACACWRSSAIVSRPRCPRPTRSRRKRLHLHELRDEGWIVGTTATLIVDACRRAGFEPRIVARTDQQNAAHAFVAAGLGVMLVTSLRLVHPAHRLAVVALTDPGVERQVYAATLDAAPPAAPTARFLALLERQARLLR